MRVRELDIGRVDLTAFDAFMAATREDVDSGVEINGVCPPRLPKMYAAHVPAEPTRTNLLVIEVVDASISDHTVERVRTALLSRLAKQRADGAKLS